MSTLYIHYWTITFYSNLIEINWKFWPGKYVICVCVLRNIRISIWSSAFYSDLCMCVCVWFGYRCRAVSVACHISIFFFIAACNALSGFVIHHIRLWYKVWLIYKTLYLRGSHVHSDACICVSHLAKHEHVALT